MLPTTPISRSGLKVPPLRWILALTCLDSGLEWRGATLHRESSLAATATTSPTRHPTNCPKIEKKIYKILYVMPSSANKVFSNSLFASFKKSPVLPYLAEK